ncbi:MAG: porin [Rubrivivax sp.]|nr:porin [Rubrivivax sp.]
MKTKIALAALATLAAGSAFAQGSTEIYGRLNLTMERQKAGDVTETEMLNNSSRIGIRGTEDLGGGLKAGFVLEHGFAADTGSASSTFWGRQSEVNLGGGFGAVRLGNFTSEAYYATADYVSMHNHDTGTSSDAFYADTRYFGQSDKIGYMSPSLGGLVFHAAVNTRDLPGETDRTYELAANYAAGTLQLGAGLQKTGDLNQFAVRALVELGAFTVGGYVQRDKNVYGTGSRSTLRLSGMYTMGATELHLNYGHAGGYDEADSSANQYTLGANYNLSKRTKVYTYYTKVGDGAAGLYGGDRNSLALGLRHNF